MQSGSKIVPAYLKEVPDERKDTKPERIDFNVVESMLRATEESEGVVC